MPRPSFPRPTPVHSKSWSRRLRRVWQSTKRQQPKVQQPKVTKVQQPKAQQPKVTKAQQPKVQEVQEVQVLEVQLTEAKPWKHGPARMEVASSRRNTTMRWLFGMAKDTRYMANFAALLEDGAQPPSLWFCHTPS